MLRHSDLVIAPRWKPLMVRRPAVSLAPVTTAAIMALLFSVYLSIGLVLTLGAEIVTGDAWSRVGNAYYVLFSRDPHVAAIGFVWNPLPSLLELPILPLAGLWRPLVDHAVAASVMSAACMALAVRELWLWLSDLRISRPYRLGLSAAFAIHPLILLYGANGMSEAPFLLFLLVAGRAFTDWTANGSVGRLAVAAMALALAYLTRYEALAPIAAVGLLTLIVSYRRARGSRRERAIEAAADGLIVGAPPFAAFAIWALASWVIVGSPFATFTSTYGNTAQVSSAIGGIRDAVGHTPIAAASYVAQQIAGLEPLIVVVLVVGAVLALLRRDPLMVISMAVFGSVLAFSGLLVLAGGSFGWLRFQITAIPLAVIVAAGIVTSLRDGARSRNALWSRPDHGLRLLGGVAGVALVLVALPHSVQTLFQPALAREEAPQLTGLIAGDAAVPNARRQFLAGAQVARYLDERALPAGSVVVDVAIGFPIVLQSTNPHQFVITPDRDFDRVVADPLVFGTHFILVPNAQGYAAFDAVGRAHPELYKNGAGMATLVREFSGGDASSTWRLYEVTR